MYVFVYGSLKNGFGNHYYMKNAQFIGEAITANPEFEMYSVHEGYPALIKGNEYIKGELYKINEDTLFYLDRLESYPNFYDRKEFEIKCDNKLYKALIYYFNNNKDTSSWVNTYIKKESPRIARDSHTAEWLKR